MSETGIDPKALAQAKLGQRRARVGSIRKRVAAAAVVVFLASGGLIGGQLALGRDPALTDAAAVTAKQSSTTNGQASSDSAASAAQGTATFAEDSGTASESPSSSVDAGQAAATPLTTSQS